ncbi:MAG: hypothetical protein ACRDT9_10015, partial [Agromyces sp.]
MTDIVIRRLRLRAVSPDRSVPRSLAAAMRDLPEAIDHAVGGSATGAGNVRIESLRVRLDLDGIDPDTFGIVWADAIRAELARWLALNVGSHDPGSDTGGRASTEAETDDARSRPTARRRGSAAEFEPAASGADGGIATGTVDVIGVGVSRRATGTADTVDVVLDPVAAAGNLADPMVESRNVGAGFVRPTVIGPQPADLALVHDRVEVPGMRVVSARAKTSVPPGVARAPAAVPG